MSFWTDPQLEPKRAYKFILSIPGGSSNQTSGLKEFLVKKVSKPEWEITSTEHKFLNHTFYYPGRTTWAEIQATVVDTLDSSTNATQELMNILEASGYSLPTTLAQPAGWGSVSKKKAVTEALGTIRIKTIDSDGHSIETWELQNAWVSKVAFGELAYDSEELVEVTLTIRYDNAFINVHNGDGPIPT